MDSDDLRLALVKLTGEIVGLKTEIGLKLDNMLVLINTGDSKNAQVSEAIKGSLTAVTTRVEEMSRRVESLELSRVELANTAATVKTQQAIIDSLKTSRSKFAGGMAVLGVISSGAGVYVGHFLH